MLKPTPLVVVIALLFLPHCFSHRGAETPLQVGPPRVHAGDEPHYIVFINSLLHDADLDLGNNYRSALAGSMQAGKRYQARPLDHHSAWYEDGRRRHWRDFYEIDRAAGKTGLKDDVDAPGDHPEPPHNVPGLAILLAPLLWPLKGTGYLESGAVILSGCAMALAALFFYGLVRHLTSDCGVAALVTGLTFLGTPLWHYGRTLFPEAYLPALLLGAVYFSYVVSRPGIAGTFLAVALFIKPPFALTAVPLALNLLARQEWRRLGWFGLPLGVSALATLISNLTIYGHPMPSPVDLEWGRPMGTWFYQWIAWDHGLLPFAPIVLLAIPGWYAIWKQDRRLVWIGLGTFLLYYTFLSSISIWTGGYCYGPRYLVPIIPLIMLGVVGFIQEGRLEAGWRIYALTFLGSLSIVINFLGAVPYWSYWVTHPFKELI